MSWEEALFWVCLVVFGLPLIGSIGTMLGLPLFDRIADAWRWCWR